MPRSLPTSILIFGIGYLLWQPAALLLLRVVARQPLPFRSVPEWWPFLLVAFGVGCFVGAAWHRVQGLPGGWRRAWLEATLPMFALGMTLQAQLFSIDHLSRWLLSIVLTSAIVGAFWAPVTRWASRVEQRRGTSRA
jgi:hypothetical protein